MGFASCVSAVCLCGPTTSPFVLYLYQTAGVQADPPEGSGSITHGPLEHLAVDVVAAISLSALKYSRLNTITLTNPDIAIRSGR